MKLALKILFIIFILWMLLGGYLEYINHSKGPIVMGLGVMYLSFILCLFLFIGDIKMESIKNTLLMIRPC